MFHVPASRGVTYVIEPQLPLAVVVKLLTSPVVMLFSRNITLPPEPLTQYLMVLAVVQRVKGVNVLPTVSEYG